jgi:nitroreductase
MTENSGFAFAASAPRAAWLAPSLALCLIFAAPALAQVDLNTPDAGNAEAGMQRLFVEGDRIVFAGDVPREDDDSIDEPDVEEFLALARAHPEIRKLELTSYGGYVPDALDFAHAVAEMGFETSVPRICSSACTLVFIAGVRRTLEPGARLGFHGSSWGRSSMMAFYEDAREDNGWLDEMAFAAWVYQEAMRDQRKEIAFMAEHGIDIGFTLRTLAVAPDDMWYPARRELIEAGVLEGPEGQ